MKVVRHNAWADIEGAPPWFLQYLGRHLSVPVEPGTKAGARFGRVWWFGGEPFGSLLHGERVAAGLAGHVLAVARHYGLQAELLDARQPPPSGCPWWAVNARWRPYQMEVHRRILQSPTGVVDAPPRAGKTLMAARAIDNLGFRSVYIAPSLAIVRQTYRVFCELFGYDQVGLLSGQAREDERDITRPIVVATAASAVRQPREWFDDRDLLVIDEFHHAAADSYHAINQKAENVYHRYCFTGTHFRSGDDMMAMEAICSDVIYRIEVESLIAGGYLARPEVHFLPVAAKYRPTASAWPQLYKTGIAEHPERNDLIVEVANALSERKVPTIVLVRRRAHADELGDRIHNSIVVKGGENALTSAGLQDFASGKVDVLIGTSVIGEGVDVPRAAALVYGSGGCDGVSMMQSYFRPLTASSGKSSALIYDFHDQYHRLLRRQAADRLRFARAQLGDINVHDHGSR